MKHFILTLTVILFSFLSYGDYAQGQGVFPIEQEINIECDICDTDMFIVNEFLYRQEDFVRFYEVTAKYDFYLDEVFFTKDEEYTIVVKPLEEKIIIDSEYELEYPEFLEHPYPCLNILDVMYYGQLAHEAQESIEKFKSEEYGKPTKHIMQKATIFRMRAIIRLNKYRAKFYEFLLNNL